MEVKQKLEPLRSMIIMDRKDTSTKFFLEAPVNLESAGAMLATDCIAKGKDLSSYQVFLETTHEEAKSLFVAASKIKSAQERFSKTTRHESGVHLTNRETKLLALLDNLITIKELSSILHVTARTVQFHLNNLYKKYGVHGKHALLKKLNHYAPLEGSEVKLLN